MTERSKTVGHSLSAGWSAALPKPKRFHQGNSFHCPFCHRLLGYTYRGKEYGRTDVEEVMRCPLYHAPEGQDSEKGGTG